MRDLEKDLEITQAATPEPWVAENAVLGDGARVTVIYSNRTTIAYLHRVTDEMPVNAKFITEARNGGWEEAIRRAMAAEAEVKKLKEVLRLVDGLHRTALGEDVPEVRDLTPLDVFVRVRKAVEGGE